MRVTLVIKTSEGGRWIVPHIREMLRRGHHVTVVLPTGPGRLRSLLEDLPIDVCPVDFNFAFTPSMSTIRGLKRLRDKIRQSRPDVVHYHLYASALAARLASLGLTGSRVHMVAGPLYLDSPLIRNVERFMSRLDSALVAGSAHTGERYKQLGFPKARISIVPYGVDTERFRPPSMVEIESSRASLGIKQDQFVAVMVAYFYGPKKLVHQGVGIKGHDILLASWKEFARLRSDVKLILVGSGFDPEGVRHRDALMREYADRELGIEWVESVTDVLPYYWAANVSISPSLSENHGSALEAGACGVPRIVSDAGGLPETTTADSGWIVPKGNSGALRAALEEAHLEFLDGKLESRGTHSRSDMVRMFDSHSASIALVDILENSAAGSSARKVARSEFAWRMLDEVGKSLNPKKSAKEGGGKLGIFRASDRRYAKTIKRSLDVASALALLAVSAPLQLVISLLIRMKLGRPVLFRQQRPGLDGKLFTLTKFRTMKNPDPSRNILSDEDRMTAFGSWLRTSSLDELPTLFNVLRGDMSMIGPRPLLTQYLERYSTEQARRHEVRPGVTGLAQVSGRNSISWEAKLQLDAAYVDRVSLRLDCSILLRTFKTLILREGIREPGHVTASEFFGSRAGNRPKE